MQLPNFLRSAPQPEGQDTKIEKENKENGDRMGTAPFNPNASNTNLNPNLGPNPNPNTVSQDDFDNNSQVNSAETTEAQGMRNLNRKRTYDAYQDLDLALTRKLDDIFAIHLSNTVDTANSVAKQAIRHADVACDALWTDELNPTMHGAEAVMAGQAPVNSQLASTASLDTVYTNITSQVLAQMGTLTTTLVGLANSVMTGQAAIVEALAAVVNQNSSKPSASTTPKT